MLLLSLKVLGLGTITMIIIYLIVLASLRIEESEFLQSVCMYGIFALVLGVMIFYLLKAFGINI